MKFSKNIVIFLTFLGVILFVFLFMNTEAINFQEHNLFNSHLRRFKELDSTINQEVFKLRYGLTGYYDPIVNQFKELKALQKRIKEVPSFVGKQDRQKIELILAESVKISQEKENLIENFKSDNAVLKNSLYYFPLLVTELGEELSNEEIVNNLNDLLRDVLIYNLNDSEELAPKINEYIENLLYQTNRENIAIKINAINIVINHAKIILDRKPKVDKLIEQIIGMPTFQSNEDLYIAYNSYYEKTLKRTSIYRFFLYLFYIILITGISAYIILKLKKAAIIVNAAKENLQKSLAATRQAEEKYRSIFENSTDGIFQTTAEGYYLSANPTLAKIYGFSSPEELINTVKNISQEIYVNPNRRNEFIKAMQQYNEISQFESRVYRQDGKIIWISENARTVRDNLGNFLYYEGTVQDISDRKQAELELEKSLSLLRATFESTADGIIAVDIEGNIISFNHKFLNMWKLREDRIHTYNQENRIAFFRDRVKDINGFFNLMQQINQQPELEINDIIEIKDNRIFELYSLPQRIGKNIVGRVWSFRDITAGKLAESALKAEKEKSEQLLLNILPEAIAQRLKEEKNIIADSFSEVTVLFADLVNFTQLADTMSPTALVKLLNKIFSAFDLLTEKYDLEKIKTIGDAYMVVGGLPTPRSDHAQAIAEIALEMQQEIATFNALTGKSFNIRIGINTGPVVAGVIGLKKFIYDLWGDAVNTASRMESHGVPGCIQITQTTYNLLHNEYLFENRGIIKVKGKGEMNTYFLTGRKNP